MTHIARVLCLTVFIAMLSGLEMGRAQESEPAKNLSDETNPDAASATLKIDGEPSVNSTSSLVVESGKKTVEEQPAVGKPENPVSVFFLKHADVAETVRKIQELHPRKLDAIIADERTNSVLVRGDEAMVKEVEQLLEVLDASPEDLTQKPAAKPAFGGSPFGGGGRPRAESIPAESPVATAQDQQLKIFSLKNADTADAARLIEQLYSGRSKSINVAKDVRSNSLVVRGDAAIVAEVEALLLRLDSSDAPQKSVENASIDISNAPLSTSTDRLREIYNEHDKRSQEIAAKAQDAESKLGKDHADVIKLKSELRDSVQQSLIARQQLHRAELAEFQKRVQRLQQSIEARDRIHDRIVDRRVEELLDPEATWQASDNSITTSDGSSTAPATGDRIIKSGDILDVTVRYGINSANVFEISTRVSNDGEIGIPDIGTTIVAGLGVIEAEQAILKLLTSKDFFRGTPIVLIAFADQKSAAGKAAKEIQPSHKAEESSELAKKLPGNWIIETLNVDGNDRHYPEHLTAMINDSLVLSCYPKDVIPEENLVLLLVPESEGSPQNLKAIYDPNGYKTPYWGIIEQTGDRLRLCLGDQENTRPSLFAAGTKVIYIEARRAAEDASGGLPAVSNLEQSGRRDQKQTINATIKFPRDSSMLWSHADPDGTSSRSEMPKVKQLGIPIDTIGQLIFHDIKGFHRWEIFLEIDPTASASLADDDLRNVSIPLTISEAELSDLTAGTVITKAAYKPKGTQPEWRGDAGLVSSQGYGQEIDPVEIAKRQGELLAVVRISAKQRPVKRIESEKELEGTWRLISEKFANTNIKTAFDLLVIDGHEYSEKMQASGASSKGKIEYGFTADPQTIDFQFDVTPLPLIMKQIFELEGTTLRIARTIDADGKNRIWNAPESFDSSDATILTYQRFSAIIGKNELGDTVEISLGSNDRLQVGQQFQVFSKREPQGGVEVLQLVGEVEVVSVQENQSTAKVREVAPNQMISIGDRIEPKPTASGTEPIDSQSPAPSE